jgi:tetratricopeptide (TPR) repeat protein
MNYSRLVIATTLLGRAVMADPNDTAESAFARGQAAQKAGRIHQACDAYEASDKLAARIETEQSLASCYEQDGKPMAAARLYRSLADKDGNADRRKTSLAKADKLEAKAPRLRFAINPMPAGLIVKVDGAEVSSTADVPVDVGPHEVVATAPGYAGHASAPVDREHAIIDVIVRMEPHAETAPAPAEAPAPLPAPSPTTTPAPASESAPMAPMMMTTETAPTDHRRRNGIIAGAAGVGVLIGSAVMYGLAESKFDDEHTLCPDSKCANNADLAKAESLLSDARTYRDIGIGTSIGGGLLLVAGGYLLFAPHTEESHVALHVDHDGAGIAYTTGF